MNWRNQVLEGDVLARLADLPDESVHCVVTSPPYWGLRDYGVDGQVGLEPTPQNYVARMVEVFEEVRRVLRSDGTLWLNLGDTYATGAGKVGKCPGGGEQGERWKQRHAFYGGSTSPVGPVQQPNRMPVPGLKPKDLVGIPWRVALALQEAGWWLRQDIIWQKPNPMPESITDRCTKAHEYLFLLAKGHRYYFDHTSIAEPVSGDPGASRNRWDAKDYLIPGQKPQKRTSRSGNKERKPGSARGCPQGTGANVCGSIPWEGATRNKRSVWSVATTRFPEAHFATFPPKLVEPCIKAGCPRGGIVLDPFLGSGTTALVALAMSRDFVGIELNPEYAAMARRRIEEKQESLRLLDFCRADAPMEKVG